MLYALDDVTTSPFLTSTAIEGSGLGAGVCNTLPVSASNTDPWHGQTAWAPCGRTVQPWCVQIALKQAAVDCVGRDTSTGSLPSWAEMACPTGMSSSLATCCPACGLGADEDEPPPRHAARVSAPAPASPAASTVRRATSGVLSAVGFEARV